jgi:lipopolysaccharide export system protein LptA
MRGRTTVRRGSARSAGLGIAAGLLLIIAGGLAWVMVRGGRSTTTITPDEVRAPPPPDVREITGGGVRGLGGAGKMYLQAVDPADPTRVQAEIIADGSDPLGNRRVRMDRPSAWVYFANGRTLLVEAAKGEATVPPEGSGGRPDDATLTGNVRVRLYEAGGAGSRPDPASTPALVTLETDRLTLDAQRGELTIPGVFTVRSERVDMDGRGVTLLVDEGAERLEYLRIDETTLCRVRPESREASSPAARAQSAAGASVGVGRGAASPGAGSPTGGSGAGAAKPPSPARASRETVYHARAADRVRVSRGGQSLESPLAEVFVRLVDGELPDGALGEIATGPQHAAPTQGAGTQHTGPQQARTMPAGRAPSPPGEGAPAGGEKATGSPREVELGWAGVLEIRPAREAPAAMARQHVLARFTAEDVGRVELRDAESGASARGALLEYGATRREGVLAGDAKGEAVVERPGTGEAKAPRFEIALGTGRVVMPSGGRIAGLGDDGAGTRALSWGSEGEFTFVVRDGTMTQDLSGVRVAGRALAEDAGGSLRAQQITGEFAEDGRTLRRVQAVGDATGRDGAGNGVRGDTIDAFLAADEGGSARVRRVVIDGRAEGVRGEARLGAGRIEADFAEDARGRPEAVRLVATGGVRYAGPDETTATAQRLEADPRSERATLLGSAVVTRGDSSIEGERIELDGGERTLEVAGAGVLRHAEAPGDGPVRTRAEVRWADGLFYDEVAGVARVTGGVHGTLTQGAERADTLRAAAAVLELDQSEGNADPRGRVRLVTLLGDDQPATLESRRYALGVTPRTLERMVYLEGGRIVADEVRGTLDVPGAGKLLAVDRRSAAEADGPARVGVAGEEAGFLARRGSTLFTWRGGLTLDRPRGAATLHDEVRMAHQGEEGEGRTDMRCDRLTARFRETVSGDGGTSGELLGADATGRVVVQANARRLDCAELAYDAGAGLIDARSTGGVVTLTNPDGTPAMRAGRIRWFLRTDRVELEGVAPVTGGGR